jgi:hypothetical protein
MGLIWHPMEGFVSVDEPEEWDAGLVSGRLVEAMKITAHTTYSAKLSYGSSWPAFAPTWEDILGRGQEARADVWARWQGIKPQYDAAALSRAEEALGWAGRYLRGEDGAARVLLVYATCKAARRPVQNEFKRRRWAASTCRAKKAKALQLIADGLNRDNVPIREAKLPVD